MHWSQILITLFTLVNLRITTALRLTSHYKDNSDLNHTDYIKKLGELNKQIGYYPINKYPDPKTDPNHDVCTITATQDCNMDFLRKNQSPGKRAWIIIPGGKTICNDGSEYRFQIFPGKTDKTLFWFQGGGVCYNYETCIIADLALRSFSPELDGVFNFSHPKNPLVENEYSIVVNNYCSGDVFVGDEEKALNDLFSSNKTKVYFNGYNNTMSVIAWVDQNRRKTNPTSVANLDILILGGASAGSVGCQVFSEYFIKKYGTKKILPDSYIGFLPSAAGVDLDYLGICKVGGYMGFSQVLINNCTKGLLHTLDVVFGPVIQAYPYVDVAYVGSIDDRTQRLFYVATSSNDYTSILTFLSADIYINKHFSTVLNNTIQYYRTLTNQYTSYLVSGTQHTFMPNDHIYTDKNNENNFSMLDFVKKFIEK